MITPEIAVLGTQLAEVAARNAAGAVVSQVTALRARKLDQGVFNELTDLVNDLVDEKNQLISIARTYEDELVAQRVSADDITYITTQILPVVETLAEVSRDPGANAMVEMVKNIITPETLTIMQLVGFNFRRAIGEPLTTLVEQLILNQVPASRPPAKRQNNPQNNAKR